MRSYLFLIVLVLIGSRLPAQTFQASVIAGANLSQIDGDMLFGFHKAGVNAGIRVVAKLDDRWRVGPEILFTQSGAFLPNSSSNISEWSRFQFNTLEIPLMAYYKDWRLTAEAGFSYQRLFSYEVANFQRMDVTEEVDLNEQLFAFNAGVTFHVNANFGVNFRWSKHIVDLDKDDAINTSFKGRTISLRLIWTPGEGVKLPKPTIDE